MKLTRIAAVVAVVAFVLAFAAQAMATKSVALGDSYSSGTGTRTFFEQKCQRSVYAYPYLLHEAHPSWTFTDAACAGATTSTLLSSQDSSVTSETNWVTYTIGGNDAGFSHVITECALPSWLSDCNGAINEAQSIIKNTLPARLDSVNNAIKSRAPNAKVVVLDYPKLFNGEDCNALTFFSSSEESRLNETAEMLRTQLSAAGRGRVELHLQGRDPGVHRARGLRRWRRLLDGVDQRALQPDERKLPPEGHRSSRRLLPRPARRHGLARNSIRPPHGSAE